MIFKVRRYASSAVAFFCISLITARLIEIEAIGFSESLCHLLYKIAHGFAPFPSTVECPRIIFATVRRCVLSSASRAHSSRIRLIRSARVWSVMAVLPFYFLACRTSGIARNIAGDANTHASQPERAANHGRMHRT
jgi:hypothetical protein